MYSAALVAFVVSWACLWCLLSGFRSLALDRPNERSLHERPVPRTGGVAVLAGSAVSLGFGGGELWVPMLIAAGLAAVSLVDDVRGISAVVRFAAHLAAAALLVVFLPGSIGPGQLVLFILAVAWITNLYNFMDGADGLAGGMTLIGFGAYAIAGYAAGDTPIAVLCSTLSAAAAAFLLYNFHPARIFLGDVGSIPLGFLAGGLGIVGWTNGAWPIWFPLLVFGPFVGDATLTLAKRVLRRERVWQAHREHYYQRMVRMGFGHRGTAAICYAAMVFCAGCALVGRDQPAALQAAAFASGTLVLACVAVWVDVRWARHCRALP